MPKQNGFSHVDGSNFIFVQFQFREVKLAQDNLFNWKVGHVCNWKLSGSKLMVDKR